MASLSDGALGPEALLNLMVKSLAAKTSDQSSPAVKDSHAAVGLFAHACMLAVGFRLIGLGEEHKLEPPSESTLDSGVPSLPTEWDASSTYDFRYAHSQSSMEFLTKVSRLGGKAMVFAVALPDDKTASFEVRVQDFISEGSIKESGSDPDLKGTIRRVFISSGRMADLSSLFKINIIQKLAPGIQKEGYEETRTGTEQPRDFRRETGGAIERPGPDNGIRPLPHDPLRDDRPEPARPYPFDDPLAAAPRRPVPRGDFPPPGFEDEYEINRPPRGLPNYGGGTRPLNIGERDLYPPGLGPHDPFGIGPHGGGGGMHPTFDDPLFGGQGHGQVYDPHAPPGARYDPVGPGDGPPSLRGGPRFPGGGGGGRPGGNPFGGYGSGDII